MKWQTYIICATALAAAAAPAHTVPMNTATNAPVESVFIMPSNPSEGRDPFFPNSTRPYESAMSKRHVELTTLEIKGYSEIAGRRFVIINNHTFGEGDEGDVMTPQGRVHVHCLTITPNSVLVESGGTRHLLKY